MNETKDPSLVPAVASTTNQPQHTKRKGPYMVVSMTGRWEGKRSLAEGRNPRKIHLDLKSAATEAIRLSGLFPGDSFAIFECIGSVETAKP